MEGEGFEPSKAEPSDLQSDPFDRSGTPPKTSRTLSIILYLLSTLLTCIVNSIMPCDVDFREKFAMHNKFNNSFEWNLSKTVIYGETYDKKARLRNLGS